LFRIDFDAGVILGGRVYARPAASEVSNNRAGDGRMSWDNTAATAWAGLIDQL